MTSDEKSKLIALGVLLVAIVLIVNLWLGHINPAIPVHATTPDRSSNDLTGMPSKPGITNAIVSYGSVVLLAGKLVEFDVPSGEAFVGSPIATVDIDWYVNGQLFRKIRAGKEDQKYSYDSPDFRKVGYMLIASDSQVSSIKLVYCRYRGPTPPDGWYPKALEATRER